MSRRCYCSSSTICQSAHHLLLTPSATPILLPGVSHRCRRRMVSPLCRAPPYSPTLSLSLALLKPVLPTMSQAYGQPAVSRATVDLSHLGPVAGTTKCLISEGKKGHRYVKMANNG
ncbi:hypothetical protein J6590_084528 [Homalodisca vitripennis]|nr:hypothetical protein J6590_084528 [Homalodisca vitripennis]